MSRRTSAAAILLAIGLPLSAAPLRAQGNAADSAWLRGDRTAAERLYALRLAADPADGVALFRLALMAGWQGRHLESIALLDRLLARWPGDHDARNARARMLVGLGRHREARATTDSVLRADPDNIGALQLEARLTGFAGDLIESERRWRAVLAREPENTESRVGLAQVLRRQGRAAAAEAVLAPILSRSASDPDLRDEADRVRLVTTPRARARLFREDDSDGNTVSTAAFHAASPITARAEVRADAWIRAARLDGPDLDASPRGGSLTLWTLFEPGWTFMAGAGVAAPGQPDLDPAATWSIAAASPRRHRWSATLAVSRQAWDFTAPMAANGIRADELELAAVGRPGRGWTVEASARTGSVSSQRSGIHNDRLSGRLAVGRTLTEQVDVSLEASGFGFDRDTDDGYFDPDFYGVAGVEAALHHESARWYAIASVMPGLQRIGSTGSPSGALHARASLEFRARAGRSLGLSAVWANTGMQQLSARPVGTYRYASVGIDFRWQFH